MSALRNKLGLGAQVSALVCGLVIIATVTIGLLTFGRFSDALIQRELEQLNIAAQTTGREFASELRAVRQDVAFVALFPTLERFLTAHFDGEDEVLRRSPVPGEPPSVNEGAEVWRTRLEFGLTQLVAARPHYSELRVVSMDDGVRELIRIEREGERVLAVPRTELGSLEPTGVLRAAAGAAPGVVQLSAFEAGEAPDPTDAIHARVQAATATSREAPRVLVLVTVDLGLVIAELEATLSAGGRLYVTDAAGDLLHHPDPTVLEEQVNGWAALVEEFPVLADAEPPAAGFGKTFIQPGPVPTALGMHAVRYDPLDPDRSCLFVEAANYRDIVAETQALRDDTLLVGLAFLAVALAAGLGLARSLTSPLRGLAEAVRAFGEGEPVTPVGAQTSQETAVLAAAFQAMVTQVEERTAALEAEVAARRRAEERFRRVLEASPAAILTIDRADRVRFVNAEAEALYGRPREDLVDRPAFELIPPRLHDFARSIFEDLFAGAGVGRVIGRDEEITTLADGAEVPVEITFTTIELPGERQVLALVEDVRARKAAQQALEERTAELERSNRDLEQFGYVVSHDLREPLRMVSSYLGLLERRYAGALDDKADEFIRHAVDGAERMQTLLSDLLRYSRVGRGGEEPAPVDTAALIDEVQGDLAQAIAESDAVIERGPCPTIPGYRAELAQLFQNLLGNALRYRGEEPPRVRVEAERRGELWQFSVRDNGIGFEQRFAGRVFEVFQRLHTQREYPGGTGIGLAIAKRVVEHHGGRIWVESAPGRGSTFRFTIHPAGPGGEAPDGGEPPAQAPPNTSDQA